MPVFRTCIHTVRSFHLLGLKVTDSEIHVDCYVGGLGTTSRICILWVKYCTCLNTQAA